MYSHRVGKAVEYMICDILKMADPVLHISSRIYDANDYITLTDSILKTIEYSKEEELEPARQLCLNLRRRQLYKMVCTASHTHLPCAARPLQSLRRAPRLRSLIVPSTFIRPTTSCCP